MLLETFGGRRQTPGLRAGVPLVGIDPRPDMSLSLPATEMPILLK
jgi:hypothetical protein